MLDAAMLLPQREIVLLPAAERDQGADQGEAAKHQPGHRQNEAQLAA